MWGVEGCFGRAHLRAVDERADVADGDGVLGRDLAQREQRLAAAGRVREGDGADALLPATRAAQAEPVGGTSVRRAAGARLRWKLNSSVPAGASLL